MISIRIIKWLTVIICLPLSISSCKKFIEVDPPYTSFSGENVYTTDATAISAITTLYARLGVATGTIDNQIPSIAFSAGLSSDELTLTSGISGVNLDYYNNGLKSITPPQYWQLFYQNIYLTNAAIEGLATSNSLTPSVKQQLLGEAYFMRAFYYFYLVNLYGDVPLVTTTNYRSNSLLIRTPANQVWQQISNDLQEAKGQLNFSYVEADVITSKSSTEKIRPNKWTAVALLARVYLYMGDYANAAIQASEVINQTSLYKLTTLSNVFMKTNNPEAIWQIQGVSTGWNTSYARTFILPSSGPNTNNPVYLNKRLVNSFNALDNRKSTWVNAVKVGNDSFYYAAKYKSATLNAPVTEYNTVLRLAEQFLIRAEARAQLGLISESKSDINEVRFRAGLPSTEATSKSELLSAILQERRLEYFTEWGHRWLDLKRTNVVDSIMSIEAPLKGGSWEITDRFYPISNDELIANPNLSQTPGYN